MMQRRNFLKTSVVLPVSILATSSMASHALAAVVPKGAGHWVVVDPAFSVSHQFASHWPSSAHIDLHELMSQWNALQRRIRESGSGSVSGLSQASYVPMIEQLLQGKSSQFGHFAVHDFRQDGGAPHRASMGQACQVGAATLTAQGDRWGHHLGARISQQLGCTQSALNKRTMLDGAEGLTENEGQYLVSWSLNFD